MQSASRATGGSRGSVTGDAETPFIPALSAAIPTPESVLSAQHPVPAPALPTPALAPPPPAAAPALPLAPPALPPLALPPPLAPPLEPPLAPPEPPPRAQASVGPRTSAITMTIANHRFITVLLISDLETVFDEAGLEQRGCQCSAMSALNDCAARKGSL
jgi:hypothetical protein